LDSMETSAAAQQQQRGAWAKDGATYWAVFNRIPSHPIVSACHYGTRVDCATGCDGLHGHVFSSEAAAAARLAILHTHYSKDGVPGAGAPIGREMGRVMPYGGGRYFYDVLALEAGQLAPGMRVNVGAPGQDPYWLTIASIELSSAHNYATRLEVYRVTWQEVIATDPNAAPSLLSSRQRYDVVRTDY
jgi:hypothetical protein